MAPDFAILLVLITVFGVLVGRFPSRKAIFKESWGIWDYLSHTVRFWLALLGPWLLVAWLPVVAGRTGSGALLSTIPMGVVAVLWVWFQPAILRTLLRAEPLDQEDLREGFARVLERARCRQPTVYRAVAKGGHWVNAFALPSLERPSVLMPDGLLEALSAEEVTAIFAHEVAHLEHFRPKRLLLGRLGFLVLATIPIVIWAGPYRSVVENYASVWPLALLFALLFAATSHQKHESASDARAAELSGDPEALIRGLTKIHVLSRISRRWDSNLEQWSSHPSLARRIQNIRRQTGETVEQFEPLVLPHASGSSQAVVLDAQNLHWLDGLPDERPSDPDGLKQAARERRSIPYQDLRDLRLVATPKDRHLVFKDVQNRTTKMSVRAEDVELLQGVLDRVDVRVNYTPSHNKVGRGRLWAALTMLLGMMPPWSWPAVAVGAIALARPAVATLAALGVVGLAGLVIGPTDEAWWFLSPFTIYAVHVMRGVLGLVCFGLALSHYRRKTEGADREAWVVALVCIALACLAAIRFGSLVGATLPGMRAHLLARGASSLVLVLLAAAAALASVRKIRARTLALVAALTGLAVLFVGSTMFRDRFTDDPFRARGPQLPIEEIVPEKIRERVLDRYAVEIVLSPSGNRFAVAVSPENENDYETEAETEYLLEEGDDGWQLLRALSFTFFDDDRAVVLEQQEEELLLRLFRVDASMDTEWELTLPTISNPRLAIGLGDNAWQVLGYDDDYSSLIRLQGTLRTNNIEETRFAPKQDTVWMYQAALFDPWVLFVNQEAPDYEQPFHLFQIFTLAGAHTTVSELLAMRDNESPRVLAKTALTLSCPQPPLGENKGYCLSEDGELVQIWSVEPEQVHFNPVGSFRGTYIQGRHASADMLLFNGWYQAPIIVDTARQRGYRLAPSTDESSEKSGWEGWLQPQSAAGYQTTALSGDVLAVSSSQVDTGGKSVVKLYRLSLPNSTESPPEDP